MCFFRFMVVVDSTLLMDPQSSWTGLDPDFDEKNPGLHFLNSGSDHPDFRRYCLIFWFQVLPHILVPGTASCIGPRYCLIPWSQVLSHTLVPGTASYPGPRYCLIPWSQVLLMEGPKNKKRKLGPNWTGNGHFGLKLGPNEPNRNFAQF